MRRNGWKDISQFIYDRKSYKRFKAKRPRAQQILNWVSKTHPFEKRLQKEVAGILRSVGVHFQAEKHIGNTLSRVDFYLAHNGLHIECKVDVCRKHTQRLIGQLLTYKFYGAKRMLVVLPDDVTIDADLQQIITANTPTEILSLSQFRAIYYPEEAETQWPRVPVAA